MPLVSTHTTAVFHPLTDYFTTTQLQTDFTGSLNTLINQVYIEEGGGTILIPDGKFTVNSSVGITLKSNIQLILGKNTYLKGNSNNLKSYEIFRIHDVTNVKISGGIIDGNREQRLAPDSSFYLPWQNGTNFTVGQYVSINTWGLKVTQTGVTGGKQPSLATSLNNGDSISDGTVKFQIVEKQGLGEWGMGVSIRGATNISIADMIIKNTWGDGIYIGRTALKTYSENVILSNLNIDYCRRQGISIISLYKSHFENIYINNISGTAPAAGVDFEPNASDEILRQINLTNVHVENCYGHGLIFYLLPLNPKINDVDAVSVVLTNCSSNRNSGDVFIWGVDNENVKGTVDFYNCSFKDATGKAFESTYCIRHESNHAKSIQWSFHDCLFKRDSDSPQALVRGNTLSQYHGGLHLYRPKFIQDGAGIYNACVMFNNNKGESFSNISVVDPIQADALNYSVRMNGSCEGYIYSDRFKSFKYTVNTSSNLQMYVYVDQVYLSNDIILTINTAMPYKKQRIINEGNNNATVTFTNVKVNRFNKTTETVSFIIPKYEYIEYECLSDGSFTIVGKTEHVNDSVYKQIFTIDAQIIPANETIRVDFDYPFAVTGAAITANYNMYLGSVDAKVYCLTADKVSLYLSNKTSNPISLASFKTIISVNP